jgi:hypothetical protein
MQEMRHVLRLSQAKKNYKPFSTNKAKEQFDMLSTVVKILHD